MGHPSLADRRNTPRRGRWRPGQCHGPAHTYPDSQKKTQMPGQQVQLPAQSSSGAVALWSPPSHEGSRPGPGRELQVSLASHKLTPLQPVRAPPSRPRPGSRSAWGPCGTVPIGAGDLGRVTTSKVRSGHASELMDFRPLITSPLCGLVVLASRGQGVPPGSAGNATGPAARATPPSRPPATGLGLSRQSGARAVAAGAAVATLQRVVELGAQRGGVNAVLAAAGSLNSATWSTAD